MPKGLNKASKPLASRPAIGGRANTTGQAATARKVITPTTTTAKSSKPVAKKVEAPEEDDAWGDAW